VIYRATLAGL